LGVRTDYNARLNKPYFIPRINAKYSFTKQSSIRASAGSGFKTANVLAENNQLLSSNRNIYFTENLMPEYSWNYGLNYSYCFEKNNGEGRFSVDVFRTDFKNQVIIDYDQQPQSVYIYNLKGQSFSNYVQVELYYPIIKRLDMRLAYKYNDVKTTQQGVLVEKVLNPRHRALINLAYETRAKNWKFDFTTQWIGKQRLPNTLSNPEVFRMLENSPSYIKMLGQITYSRKAFDIYAGSENITNYRQLEVIIDPQNPYGTYFDAGNIWGPTLGRMLYMGFRYTVK
jgi:outer membrane receptor for ferrienterochelin and colicin